MERHKIYLRIMLWLLGLAACLGVISVLFAAYDLMGRVIGTAVLVGVCSGLMIPVSKLADRQETRTASMLGMGIMTLDFVLALLLIGVEPVRESHLKEELAETLASVTFPGFMAVILLGNLRREVGRAACRVGLVSSAVVMLLFLGATWLGELCDWGRGYPIYAGRSIACKDIQQDLWGTGLALAVYGLLAVAILAGETVGHRKWWRWTGTMASAAACAMWLVYIWAGTSSPLGEVICSALSALAAVTTYANIVGFVPLPVTQSWLRQGCVVCAAGTAMILVLYVAYTSRLLPQLPKEELNRLGAAGGILTGCGSLALAAIRFT